MSARPRRVVYAFPHAGGSAALYRAWQAEAWDDGVLAPVEMPGRGSRIRMLAMENLPELAAWLADQLCADLRERQAQGVAEWATFGHSFGGVLSVIVASEMSRRHGLTPRFSVVSASIAPSIQPDDERHLFSDEQILAVARADQGTPEAVLREPALAGRVAAQLRCDYRLRRQFLAHRALKVPQTLRLIGAEQDPHVTLQQLRAWEAHSEGGAELHTIPGDHFAIYRHWQRVRDILSSSPREATI
ncbi:thioesterase II family protein [Chromobacterium alticapitis]|uniref:Thioesterase n=1 Tax=Chromobacterium alticapitis TaxID=2073169 RepID=A0A2S5DEK6_9NEIS|nr:alpha/beta fold hydrolase [Chromobacterium alticapitis]POZ61407.1 thioesterase [Chromobacterium alticapitis]